jgi:hypothetical protein
LFVTLDFAVEANAFVALSMVVVVVARVGVE